MSKAKKRPNEPKRPPKRPEQKSGTSDSSTKQPPPGGSMTSPESIRETIESIVIAFILAFLFRTFEAEAFVIPTGSMAPTLLGRHKDVECPECGYFYTASASQEIDSNTNQKTNNWTLGATCPMCRYTTQLGPDNPQGKKYKSYSGDRILVEKFPFQFRDPERFEVCVFKFPGGARTNYIKRICGLPNETIKIKHGDLFVKRNGEAEFTIARKENPKRLLAVLQPVYDTDYVSSTLAAAGLNQRWINDDGSSLGTSPGWTTDDQQTFRVSGDASSDGWLRYQHVVPSESDWHFLQTGASLRAAPRRQLISDFTAYNTRRARDDREFSFPLSGRGVHWVGDLAVEFDTKVESDAGEILIELVEGGRRFQCAIDIGTGTASLSIDGQSTLGTPKAQTRLQGAGSYQVRFANVDDQLRLWIDGRLIEFDSATTYEPLGNFIPTPADLLPAGIASRGVGMEVNHIRLLRDLYYIADKDSFGPALSDYDFSSNYDSLPRGIRPEVGALDELFSDPELWSFFADFNEISFELNEGEFLALGDNSGESKDSRLWAGPGVSYCVPRDLLIGKALFIYWPHSQDRIPGTNIWFPLFPNFKRMWVIR